MAFKMKSGSPMKRNFGVGESPAKQKSPVKDLYSEHNKKHESGEWDKDHKTTKQKSPNEMKSPVKHSGAEYKKEVKEKDNVDVRPRDVKGHDKGHKTEYDANHVPYAKKETINVKKGSVAEKKGKEKA